MTVIQKERLKMIMDINRHDFLKVRRLAMVLTVIAVFTITVPGKNLSQETSIRIWPKLKTLLHAEANEHTIKLTRSSSIIIDAGKGVLAPDIDNLKVSNVAENAVSTPSDGFLVFTIDTAEDMYVTGSAILRSDKDLRPGLRA